MTDRRPRGFTFALGIDYTDSPHRDLPNSVADAERISEFFETYGSFLPQHHDEGLPAADSATIMSAIASWTSDIPRDEDRTRSLVFYIGGHGAVERQEHFTRTAHSPISGPLTGQTAIRASSIVDEILVSGASQALLIFDSCQSGAATADVLDAVRRSMLSQAGPVIDVVCLAACLPYETAEGGALVNAMLDALHQGFGGYNPSDRYEYVDVTDLRDELHERLRDTQTVTLTGTGGRRILPNPNYRPSAGDRRVQFSALLSELDENDREHFLRKASGTDADELWLFSGRSSASKHVVEWLADTGGGMLAITGPPGIGKSAFLGRLAVLADPSSREACVKLGLLDDDPMTIPRRGTFDAVLHLKNRSVEFAAEDLAAQLSIDLRGSTAPARDLWAELLRAERRVCVLADALDEAERGQEGVIALDLLRAIASLPGCKVVVGTRRDRDGRVRGGVEDQGPLIGALRPYDAEFELVDLGDELEASGDIAEYVTRGLTGHWASEARRVYAGHEIAALASGVFLYAHYALRVLAARPETIVDEVGWRSNLPAEIGSAGLAQFFEADLLRFTDPERVRETLLPLAFARGKGMPRRVIWPRAATAISATGRAFNDADIALTVREAGWYLVEATEGGEAVYRLYHQAIADHLRTEATRAI